MTHCTAPFSPCWPPGRELILPEPTFEMLPRYARLAGAEVVSLPWLGGTYPTAAVLRRITARTAMICVVSPNNPTGSVATPRDLRRLSRAAPHALIVVDLAYTEFADVDLTPVALALPNTLITRTFSKAWGLAGVRVGYAMGRAEHIHWLRAAGNPYAVAGPSAALAAAWLDQGRTTVDIFVARVRAERALLTAQLLELGAAPEPSQANFVLARFADAPAVCDALAARGIAVRAFLDRPGLQDALRITCPGEAAAFSRLTATLNELRGVIRGGVERTKTNSTATDFRGTDVVQANAPMPVANLGAAL